MLGNISGNRQLIVPLIVVAVAAIGIAGFRVVKSAERSGEAAQRSQAAAEAQQPEQAGRAAGVQGAILGDEAAGDFVLVSHRDPFSHFSLFAGPGPDYAGPGGEGLDGLGDFLSESPFARLIPFAPEVGSGPAADGGPTGDETESPGPPDASRRPGGDPGFCLASIIGGLRPLAIITDSAGGKFFVSQGETLSQDYVVESIHSRSVVLRKGDVRVSLWLNATSNELGD